MVMAPASIIGRDGLEQGVTQAEGGSPGARSVLSAVREDIRETMRMAWLDPSLEAVSREPVFFAAAWSAIRPSVGRSFLLLARTLREQACAVARSLGARDLLSDLTPVLAPEEAVRLGEASRAAHLAAAKTQIVLHLFLRAARRERTRGTGQEEPPSRRGVPDWQRWMAVLPTPDGEHPWLPRATERFGTIDAPPALRPFARWPVALDSLWRELDPVVDSVGWGRGATHLRRSLMVGLDGLPHPVALQWAALRERGFDEADRLRTIRILEAHDGPAAGQTLAAAFAWVAFGSTELGQEA
jgi:hypothetical protein